MERLLRDMVEVEDELAVEGNMAFVGTTRYAVRTVRALTRLCLISPSGGSALDTYWHLAPCGRRIIEDPAYEPAIITAIQTGRPVIR